VTVRSPHGAARAIRGVGRLARGAPIAIAAATTTVALQLTIDRPPVAATAAIVLAAAGGLLGVGWAERRMGHLRTVVAVLAAAAVDLALRAGMEALDLRLDLYGVHAARGGTIDPLLPAIGAVTAASAFCRPLVGRRLRVVAITLALVFALYSGTPVDLVRLAAVGAGIAIGMLLARERPRRAFAPVSRREWRVLLAAAVAITALGPVASILLPSSHGVLAPLGRLFEEPFTDWAALAAACPAAEPSRRCVEALALSRLGGPGALLLQLLPLLALLLAAAGIRAGRQAGLWLAIAIDTGIAAAAAVYFGVVPLAGATPIAGLPATTLEHYRAFTAVAVLFPLAVAVLCAASVRAFPRDVRPGEAIRFAVAAVAGLVGASAVYLGVAWSLRDQFESEPSLVDLLTDLPERFVPPALLAIEPRDVLPVGTGAVILSEWIGPAYWIVLVGSAWLAVRRLRARRAATGPDAARTLLRDGAGGAISWMTTWPGHEYWRDPRGTVVAFRVIGNVAITTGEPLGTPGSEREAALAFAVHCADRGWTPAWYSIGDGLREELAGAGWFTARVAEEAVVDVRAFELEGRRMRDVRTALHRAEREGLRASWTSWSALPAALAGQVAELCESWLADKPLPELGFTLGGLDEAKDPDVRLLLVVSAADRIEVVTSWLPRHGRTGRVGWTLDLMRRRADAVPGATEFAVVSAVERAREDGLTELSLSGAPLATIAQEDGEAGLAGALVRRLEPVYGFRSLLRFKAKFRPAFRPLWLAVPDPLALPRVGVALARAYLPSLSGRQVIRLLAARRTGAGRAVRAAAA